MNTETFTFPYKDDIIQKDLIILLSCSNRSIYVDIKVGNLSNEEQKKLVVSRIVRIIICNKILPEIIATANVTQLENDLIKCGLTKLSISTLLPHVEFKISVSLNNKTLKYNVKTVQYETSKYSTGILYNIGNKPPKTFDCTEYKPYIYCYQNTVKKMLSDSKKNKRYHIQRINLNITNGKTVVYLLDKTEKIKEEIKKLNYSTEFPSLNINC